MKKTLALCFAAMLTLASGSAQDKMDKDGKIDKMDKAGKEKAKKSKRSGSKFPGRLGHSGSK